MTWSKVDDSLHDHRKVDAALEADERVGAAALGLWVLALSYAGDQLTDGLVSRRAIARLMPEHGFDLAGELVRVGLFVPVDGGWQISGLPGVQPDA
jgi:hypothetical protein